MTTSSGPRLGIVGGGQLGRMLAEAAKRFDASLHVLTAKPDDPASASAEVKVGNVADAGDVEAFGRGLDVVTIEREDVSVEGLYALERGGVRVFPQPRVLEIIRDKGVQKAHLSEAGYPTCDFERYPDAAAVRRALEAGSLTLPFVQKARREGFDGRGVRSLKRPEDLEDLLDVACIVEERVDIARELAVVAARSERGEVTVYPVTELGFDPAAHILTWLACPARISEALARQASELARTIASDLEIVGLLAVELFVDTAERLLVNELSPRPHNSGHHTIEACVTSQYEQHARCVLGLPLGDTSLHSPAAMVNLLAGADGSPLPSLDDWQDRHGVYVHLYGKREARPYRKMGHVTIIDPQLSGALERAEALLRHLGASP